MPNTPPSNKHNKGKVRWKNTLYVSFVSRHVVPLHVIPPTNLVVVLLNRNDNSPNPYIFTIPQINTKMPFLSIKNKRRAT